METLELVLQFAAACRLVLPRRFEGLPSFIEEPDEASGGLPYRAGAAALSVQVLSYVLAARAARPLMQQQQQQQQQQEQQQQQQEQQQR